MSEHAVVLANRIPFPLDDGWKVRAFHVLKFIVEEMPTTLVVFSDAKTEEAGKGLAERFDGRLRIRTVDPPKPYAWWRLALGVASRHPIQYWNNRTRAFQAAVAEVCQRHRPALGMAVCAFMYPYLRAHPEIPCRIIDTHNVDSDLMRRYRPYMTGRLKRLYAGFTERKLAGLENWTFREADQVWVCSDDEAELLHSRDPRVPVSVIPNGVDVEHFSGAGGEIRRGQLLFFGKLDYFPNTDALDFLVNGVLPLLKAREVDYSVKVVGAGSSAAVEEICTSDPDVELVGRVEDVRPWLAQSELVLVPLRMGSGTRLKVLEAMAAGRPVLTTPIGAEGIRAQRGEDILEAESAEDFAGQIVTVLQDPEFGDAVGARGREAVKRRYDWTAVGRQISGAVRVGEPGKDPGAEPASSEHDPSRRNGASFS